MCAGRPRAPESRSVCMCFTWSTNGMHAVGHQEVGPLSKRMLFLMRALNGLFAAAVINTMTKANVSGKLEGETMEKCHLQACFPLLRQLPSLYN